MANIVFTVALAIPSNVQKVVPAQAKKLEIVIVGTAVKAGAVLVRGTRGSRKSVTVRRESVVDKPNAVVLNAGDKIRLVPSEVWGLRPGIQGTFYTAGWIRGDGIAVREIARELPDDPPDPRRPAQKKKEAIQARKVLDDSELRAQIQAADLVVVGAVKEVRAAAIPAAPESTAVTEHDPRWQEAIIHSDSVIKGPSTGKDFIVHFPASVDVARYEAPKLKPGQAGVFLLKQDTVSGAPTVMFQNRRVQAYTVLNPGDILGKEEAQRVRSLAVK